MNNHEWITITNESFRYFFSARSPVSASANYKQARNKCASGQYMCKDGTRCIDENFVCDSYVDCNDNSDEDRCSLGTFTSEWFPFIFPLSSNNLIFRETSEYVIKVKSPSWFRLSRSSKILIEWVSLTS